MLLKLNFKNAFNCLQHDTMLMTVKESIPELLVPHGASHVTHSNVGHNQFQLVIVNRAGLYTAVRHGCRQGVKARGKGPTCTW